MSNINTDERRKALQKKTGYSKRDELGKDGIVWPFWVDMEWELIDEIDRQAAWFKDRDNDPKLFREEVEQIKRRTKEACFKAAWEYLEVWVDVWQWRSNQEDSFKWAIDSVVVAP